MNLIKLNSQELQLGMTLAWPVFGGDGQLLLQTGETISTQRKLDVLISRGASRQIKPEVNSGLVPEISSGEQNLLKNSPLAKLETIKSRNHKMLQGISTGKTNNYMKELACLATEIAELSEENADILLGSLLLDRDSIYIVIHPIMVAVACELMSKRLELIDDERKTITMAALIANVGMLDLMDTMSEQTEEPATEQRLEIFGHPRKSYELLMDAEINDPEILNIVLKHHEKIDGSGYPDGLQGDNIPISACILSLADIYAAMVLPRKYRDGIYAKKAIQYIFLQRTESVLTELVNSFIKEMGIYPPGIFVKLVNGEKGIVIKRGLEEANKPIVSILYNDYGAALESPKIRDTKEHKVYEIKEVLTTDSTLHFDLLTIWGYKIDE